MAVKALAAGQLRRRLIPERHRGRDFWGRRSWVRRNPWRNWVETRAPLLRNWPRTRESFSVRGRLKFTLRTLIIINKLSIVKNWKMLKNLSFFKLTGSDQRLEIGSREVDQGPVGGGLFVGWSVGGSRVCCPWIWRWRVRMIFFNVASSPCAEYFLKSIKLQL